MNSQAFRDRVEAALAHNEELNRLAGRRKGERGYLCQSHADIADALKTSQRMIDKILGGVREGTEIKLTEKSKYIPRIRNLLGLDRIELTVPAERADVLAQIASLPEKEFARYRESVERRRS